MVLLARSDCIVLYLSCTYIVPIEGVKIISIDLMMLQVRLVLMCVFGPQNIVLAVIVSARMGYLALNTVGSSQSLISKLMILAKNKFKSSRLGTLLQSLLVQIVGAF